MSFIHTTLVRHCELHPEVKQASGWKVLGFLEDELSKLLSFQNELDLLDTESGGEYEEYLEEIEIDIERVQLIINWLEDRA